MTAPAIQLRLGRGPGRSPERQPTWAPAAAGVGLTALLVAMLALGMRPGAAWLPGSDVLAPATPPERVTYVDVPPVLLRPPAEPLPADPSAPAARQTPHISAPALPNATAPTVPIPGRRTSPLPVPGVDSAGSAGAAGRTLPRAPGARLPDGITLPPPARAGTPPVCAAPCVGGTTAGVNTLPAPLTAAERDSALQALERSIPGLAREIERRDRALAPAKPPADPGAIPQLKGISIPTGLPGGGPSKAERERDRKVHAENAATLERIKARQDSIARADSVRRARGKG